MPALPLEPGQLACPQVRMRSRLWCIVACRGVHFNGLYPLLCLNSLLTSAWYQLDSRVKFGIVPGRPDLKQACLSKP